MHRLSRLLSTLIAAVLLVAPAKAQGQAEIGTLTCTGGAGVGLILGSQKTYRCSFQAANGSPSESYRATITKIGIDIGITGQAVMVWTVFASGDVRARMLRGNYTGAAADASLGLGGGAKVLVGGSSNSVILQPVSVQGQTGVNLAVGVASLSIR